MRWKSLGNPLEIPWERKPEQICKVNTHLGIEQSRRDDLEAVGYATWPHRRGQ